MLDHALHTHWTLSPCFCIPGLIAIKLPTSHYANSAATRNTFLLYTYGCFALRAHAHSFDTACLRRYATKATYGPIVHESSKNLCSRSTYAKQKHEISGNGTRPRKNPVSQISQGSVLVFRNQPACSHAISKQRKQTPHTTNSGTVLCNICHKSIAPHNEYQLEPLPQYSAIFNALGKI